MPYSFLLILSLFAFASAHAQQTNIPATVQVQGLDQVITSLQRIERQLQQFADSRWEYRFVQRNLLDDIDEQIKTLGAEGWELVSVTQQEGFILKRRVLPQ